jgi:hypothetical protein
MTKPKSSESSGCINIHQTKPKKFQQTAALLGFCFSCVITLRFFMLMLCSIYRFVALLAFLWFSVWLS